MDGEQNERIQKSRGIELKMQSDPIYELEKIYKKSIEGGYFSLEAPDSIIRDHTGWTNFTRSDSDDPRDRTRFQFIPGWIYLNDTQGGINLIRLIGYETYRATPNRFATRRFAYSQLALARLVFQILSSSSFQRCTTLDNVIIISFIRVTILRWG